MKKIIHYFILFSLLICCMSIYANTVDKVYRADSRDYNYVFTHGFTAWGSNRNYIQHIDGTSGVLGTQDSAFIPTSANEDIALRFASGPLHRGNAQTFYIYTIRPDSNFYSAEDTLQHIYATDHTVEPNSFTFYLATNEREYTAYRTIPADQIISAQTVTLNDEDEIVLSNPIANPYYVSQSTTSNPEPYTGSDDLPTDSRPILLVGANGEPANNILPNEVSPTVSWYFGALGHSEL